MRKRSRMNISKSAEDAFRFGGGPAWVHSFAAEGMTRESGPQQDADDELVDRIRELREWKARPSRPDNHWLDCLVVSRLGVQVDFFQPVLC